MASNGEMVALAGTKLTKAALLVMDANKLLAKAGQGNMELHNVAGTLMTIATAVSQSTGGGAQ